MKQLKLVVCAICLCSAVLVFVQTIPSPELQAAPNATELKHQLPLDVVEDIAELLFAFSKECSNSSCDYQGALAGASRVVPRRTGVFHCKGSKRFWDTTEWDIVVTATPTGDDAEIEVPHQSGVRVFLRILRGGQKLVHTSPDKITNTQGRTLISIWREFPQFVILEIKRKEIRDAELIKSLESVDRTQKEDGRAPSGTIKIPRP